MSDVQDWFTTEIQNLGFAGLEGVYDYVATMPDDEVRHYLYSLLGSEPQIKSFADTFIRNRATGTTQQAGSSSVADASKDASLTSWATPGSSAQAKKTKKSRGKSRGNASKTSNPKPPDETFKSSFADATASRKPDAPKTAQATAIKNAPVEQVQKKIREYRKTKRVINCIRCGKVEEVIREDGACSFCGAPMFSIYGDEQSPPTSNTASRSSSLERHRARTREPRPYPVVLGRFVYPAGTDSKVVNLAGNTLGWSCRKEETSFGHEKAANREVYRNSNINNEDLEAAIMSIRQSLQRLGHGEDSENDGLPRHVQGRLQIDDLSPSVRPFDLPR